MQSLCANRGSSVIMVSLDPARTCQTVAMADEQKTINRVKSECSGCFRPFVLNTKRLTLTVKVESNGKRGNDHVPSHDLTIDVEYNGYIYRWECPACEYADSYVPDFEN